MDEKDKLNQSLILIGKHFDLNKEESSPLTEELDPNAIRLRLAALIKLLLEQDFARLIQGFYRIDVDESRFREIIALENPDTLHETLADLVIEREMKKVETRLKYASGTS